MAQLKDLLVNGVSRLVGDVFLDKLNAPTTSTGNNFGLGTSGQVLKTNGDNIYWDDALTIGYGDTVNPYAAVNQNYVLAGPVVPEGLDFMLPAPPSFRKLVEDDIPTLSPSKSGLGNAKIFYGTCATAAAAKVVTCSSFTTSDLVAGTIIFITFSANNTGAVASLTLNINSTGAKNIKSVYNGTIGNLPAVGLIEANTTYRFTYNGTYWIIFLDNVVKQSASTSSSWRKVLLHTTESAATTTAVATTLAKGPVYAAVGVSVQPSTGTLAATKFQGNGSSLTNLNASNVASGTLSTSYGGTGVSTAAANTVFAGPVSGSNAAPSFRKLQVTDIPYGTGIIYCESASNATALTGTINKNFDGNTEDAFLIIFKNDIQPTSANLSSFTFSLNNTTAQRIYFGTDNAALNTSILKGPIGNTLYRLTYVIAGSNKYYVLGDASSFNVTVDSSYNTVSIGYMNDSPLPITLNRPYRLYTSSSGMPFDTEVNHVTTIPLNVTDEQLQSLNFLLITIQIHNSNFLFFPSTSTTGYTNNIGSFSSHKLVYVPMQTGAAQVINFENIETRYYNGTYAEIVKSSYIIPVIMSLQSDSTTGTKNLQITIQDSGKCVQQILRVNSVYVSSTNSYSSTNHNSYLTSLISNSDLSIDTVTGI